MSPRRSVAEARNTKDMILTKAIDIASLDGLEGITIGRLADELKMSKSGVLGHFGTKQSLQLAAIRSVISQFRIHVVEPSMGRAPGLERLLALCDTWFDYVTDTGLPGGCLMTAAALEFDGRAGEVHDVVAEAWSDWDDLLRGELRRSGGDFDVDQALFEIVAFGPAVNRAVQLFGDRTAAERAKRAVRRVIGQ
ncbi:AcrR family transcriptional regulator [Kibdelosporangium banguiense]|uniref:AcrR family transcriptional regulator n=1 Tax=Kibdelosporangium banguiense TaxID=1365924 RepID=A0ABS4U2Z3_9PSEU|nr:TetR family transcriptional regulator [Kibdelosporangium banguiense]MBP2330985.1 AcrR family transcriptional regulator [Kibdelosporangium banguiense]